MQSRVNDYANQAVFDLEMETLFNHFFHFGAHKSELALTDSFITITVAEKSIVLWNDEGSIRVFENACPHRGCQIVSEEAGRKKLVCPYHGWSFRKGQTFPSQKGFLDHGKEKLSLTYYTVEYCGDFIFFSPNPQQSLPNQLDAFYADLALISKSITASVDSNKEPFDCNWKIAVENALETYHVNRVHSETLSLLRFKNIRYIYSANNDVMIADIGCEKSDKKLQKIKEFFDIEYRKDSYYSFYLFPFGMLSSTYGLSFAVQTFFPHSVDKTSFTSRVYRVNTIFDSFYDNVVAVNRKIFKEDADICGLVQAAVTCHKDEFFLGVGEERIQHFHDKYKEIVK